MAFADTRSQRANKNIQRLLDYFLEQKLMGQRYGMMGELETQRQAGYMGLEEVEHKNMQERAYDKWIYDTSQLPEIQQSLSEIFVKRQSGMDTKPDEANLGQIVLTRGQAALRAVKGTLEPRDMNNLMKLSDATVRQLLQEYGATTRQKERIERVEAPGLVLRGEELGVRRGELKAREAEGGREYYRNIHAKANGVLLYLQKAKEEGTPIDLSAVPKGEVLNKWIESLAAGPRGGLVGGALTPQAVGDLMAKISALDTKAMRQVLTPEEEGFIDNAYDIFGYKSGQEDLVLKLKNMILEEAAKIGAQITPEEAEQRARERLRGGIRR